MTTTQTKYTNEQKLAFFADELNLIKSENIRYK